MKDETSKPCPYVVATRGSGFNKTEEFCGKIPSEDSCYCPKHVLIIQDEREEIKRRSDRRIVARNLKTFKMEELAKSPLAAINPNFDEEGKRITGYER